MTFIDSIYHFARAGLYFNIMKVRIHSEREGNKTDRFPTNPGNEQHLADLHLAENLPCVSAQTQTLLKAFLSPPEYSVCADL